ncbi:MAG: hypothetical protein ABEJ24_00965 [Candidatus Magasanikbacteria bacterium]
MPKEVYSFYDNRIEKELEKVESSMESSLRDLIEMKENELEKLRKIKHYYEEIDKFQKILEAADSSEERQKAKKRIKKLRQRIKDVGKQVQFEREEIGYLLQIIKDQKGKDDLERALHILELKEIDDVWYEKAINIDFSDPSNIN